MRRTSRRRVKKNRKLPVLIILGLIAVCVVAGVVGELVSRRLPTKELANLEELYGAEDGYASVIANHQWIESQALWESNHAYLAYEVIRDELNGRFYWDPVEKILLYTLPEETVRAEADSEFDGAPVFVEQNDTVYVSLSYVEQYSNIAVEYFENPTRIVLQTEWGEQLYGTLKNDTSVRVRGGIKSEIITPLTAGDSVTILEQMDHWSEVQTKNGFIGYIPNNDIGETYTVEEKGPYTGPEYTGNPVDYDICLLWHQTLSNNGLKELQSFLAVNSPVTTIAPTWFSLSGDEGSFTTLASDNYVKKAHKAGIDVWPVLDNVNHTDLDMVTMLQTTSNRNRLIQAIMVELENCGADGLNLDFENIPEEAGDGFIQLVRELSVECRRRGLVLSVDNNVPSAWTEHYHRDEQGIVADYLIIMGYDEHYSGSDPGSTASLPFVQAGITGTLDLVPAEKVVNGIPFYTRLWTETPTELTSEAIGMDKAAEFVTSHAAEKTWLDEVGQNYVRVEENETVYQIWLEDAESMGARLEMMEAYQLAGAAFWKMGMENDNIWQTIFAYYSSSAEPGTTQESVPQTAVQETTSQTEEPPGSGIAGIAEKFQ